MLSSMKKIFVILFAFLFVGIGCEQAPQPPVVQDQGEEIIIDIFPEPEPEQPVEKAPNAIGDANKCSLLPDVGPCRGNFTRYYYDLEKGCTAFAWGGCQGVVPFASLDDCMNLCGKVVLGDNGEPEVVPEQPEEPVQPPQQPLKPQEQPKPEKIDCNPGLGPVCTADNVTYADDCEAMGDGKIVTLWGATCEELEENREKLGCNPGLGPVCTADNVTYADDCAAEAAGKVVTMWGAACPEEEDPQPAGCTDNDNDGAFGGVGCTPYDCDDNSKYIPFDFEVCIDGLDNDCDGQADESPCKIRRICLGEGCSSTITYIDEE